MKKVFVSGASGNVGRAIVKRIAERGEVELVGGWCMEAGEDLGALAGTKPLGVRASGDLAGALDASRPDVVIDFTIMPVLLESLQIYLDRNLDVVVGTTGLTEEQLAPCAAAVAEKGLRWAVISNYGLGIALVQNFVKSIRRYYPYVSIADRHPAHMKNAPSGTAVDFARALADGPKGAVESRETQPGVLGGEIAGVQVVSQRMSWPGPYSEHEIMLGRPDEIIRISVEDHTSDIYMDGVFLTIERLISLPRGSFIRDLSEMIDL